MGYNRRIVGGVVCVGLLGVGWASPVPKNMNLVFLLILSVLFLKDKPKLDASVIIDVIIYSLVGMFIEWRNVILKNH